MKIKLKTGDFIKLPEELKKSAKTEFEYGKVKGSNGQIIDLYLVDEKDVNKNRLHSNIERDALTFCLHHYDIHY